MVCDGKTEDSGSPRLDQSWNSNIAVNRQEFETYFPRETSRLVVMQPFDVTEQVGRFDVFATLAGGGTPLKRKPYVTAFRKRCWSITRDCAIA